MNTDKWTTRCAGCGLVRPFNQRDEHDCPNKVRLEDALDVLTSGRRSLSSNGFSVDDQIADVLREVGTSEAFVKEFPEYATLTWSGSWVDTEASGVDPEYMSWVADWIEANTDVFWEEGEPWLPVGRAS